jgi:hypothetical protein
MAPTPIMRLLIALMLSVMASAQTSRTVVLTWQDGVNPTDTTYSVYRAQGPCQSGQTFAPVATGITALTYSDPVTKPGQYCYYATATYGGLESDASNNADAKVKPVAPRLLSVTVN